MKGYSILLLVFLSSVLFADKPNFVIVLADDVSWSSFGCTDGGLYTRTPHIDKLASEGLQFTNFLSVPWPNVVQHGTSFTQVCCRQPVVFTAMGLRAKV